MDDSHKFLYTLDFILAGGLLDPMVLDVKGFSKRRVHICGTICSLVMFRTYRISESWYLLVNFPTSPQSIEKCMGALVKE